MYVDHQFAHTITGVVKDSNGNITAYELDTGETIMKEHAVMMAKQGTIKGVTVSVSKLGEEFLKSLPDGDKNNNLDELPVIPGDEIK